MKHKNKKTKRTSENESLVQWRRSFILNRQKEARLNKREKEAARLKNIFERKRADASDRHAPNTLRTRGYYRFTKEYPSTVDANGFRDNSPSRKVIRRRLITAALICIAVFSLTFVLTDTCIKISNTALPETTSSAAETEKTFTLRCLHFTYEELRDCDTEYFTEHLNDSDCDTALFEFKDDYGYVMFNTGSFIGRSADRRISSAAEKVKALHEEGFSLCAYISCWKDTVASSADLTYSVRNNSSEGASWIDNSGSGWLNPFSANAKTYVLNIIKCAAEAGFDRIIVNNVCFSADSGTAQQYYAGESTSSLSRNEALTDFIESASKVTGKAVLTVMCTPAAFDISADDSSAPYYGNLISAASTSICIDARLSVQQKNFTMGEISVSDATLMPYVFVLAAAEYAEKSLADNGVENCENLVCIESNSNLEEEIDAVRYSGADGYIIW